MEKLKCEGCGKEFKKPFFGIWKIALVNDHGQDIFKLIFCSKQCRDIMVQRFDKDV